MRRSSIAAFHLLSAVGLVGLLSGCGSGGEGAPSGPVSGNASGTAAASGTITGFGSIFVNGKKFEANGVEVRRDGVTEQCDIDSRPANRCGLKEGMTVKVSGAFSGSSHRASTITQEDTVEGPITGKVQVGQSNGTLTILGQTVLVDETTVFDDNIGPTKLDNLAVSEVVEVSGFVKDGTSGIIVASFIEKKAGATGCNAICEIKGIVKGHNHSLTTFQIGGLTVVYNNTTDTSDMPVPSGSNWDTLFVEVKGTALSGTTLTATKVEPENRGVGDNVDEFEVEGFVRQAGTPNGNIIDFTIGTTPVQTTANTEFRGGTIDEIVVDAKLSAEGRFANGILTAKHVKFHASVRLEGNATINGNTLTLAGLPGVTITVNSQTEIRDGGNTITLNDLGGNHIRVRGRVSGPSSVIATRIVRRSVEPDVDVDLQGPVQVVSNPNLTILGVTVNTAALNDNDFEGLNDQPIGRAAFFNAVKVGALVKVKGQLNGAVVTWGEAELED